MRQSGSFASSVRLPSSNLHLATRLPFLPCTHGFHAHAWKNRGPGFLLPPGFASAFLMLFQDDAEAFAHSEQNNLDIGNKSGMIEL